MTVKVFFNEAAPFDVNELAVNAPVVVPAKVVAPVTFTAPANVEAPITVTPLLNVAAPVVTIVLFIETGPSNFANPDDTIKEEVLSKKMLIVDEHIEIICDYASYKLLSKVDAERASYYKVNFDEWLQDGTVSPYQIYVNNNKIPLMMKYIYIRVFNLVKSFS